MAETPQSCQAHQPDYKRQAWEMYTLAELGYWVHLLVKRATHRTNPEKKKKDLYDAKNYLKMMEAKLDDLILHGTTKDQGVGDINVFITNKNADPNETARQVMLGLKKAIRSGEEKVMDHFNDYKPKK